MLYDIQDFAVTLSSAVTGMLVGTAVKKATDNNTAACVAGASSMVVSHVAINKGIEKIKIKINRSKNNHSDEVAVIANA